MKSLPNLIKPQFVNNHLDSKRLIDSNPKMEALWKKAEHNKMAQSGNHEFQEGIFAEPVSIIEPETMVEDAQEEAQRIIQSANEKAEQILILSNQERDKVLQEASTQGQMEGYRQGIEEAEKEYNQKKDLLEKEKQALEKDYQSKLAEVENQVVETLLTVIDQVLEVQLEDFSPIILGLVKKSIRHIDHVKEFKIFLNQKQLDYIQENIDEVKEQISSNIRLECLLDSSLTDIQCRIETDFGSYHCGYDAYYKNLIKDIKTMSL